MPNIPISKLDAAKRQLDTAIKLFFREDDPVSIHTLVCAAYEIIYIAAKSQKIPTILRDNPFIKEEYKKQWYDLLVEAQNFFKHGQRDIKKTIDFNPEITTKILLDAVETYMQLTNQKPSNMQAFRAWFLLKNPKLITGDAEQFIMFAKRAGYCSSNKVKFFELIKFIDETDIGNHRI